MIKHDNVHFHIELTPQGLKLCCSEPSYKVEHLSEVYDFKEDKLGRSFITCESINTFINNLFLSGRLLKEDVTSGKANDVIEKALVERGYNLDKKGKLYRKDI